MDKDTIIVRDKQFYKTVALIAIPVIFQSLITIGVNMTDTMMLGKMGEDQLAGSSLANDFINIFQIMCMGMGYGAAVMTARHWGSKDIKALKKIVTIMLRVCLCISSIFSILAFVYPDNIMNIFSSEPDIIANGVRYFKISAFTFIPMGITLTLTAVLRSVRETRVPLILAIVAFFANIFFNWVFIFGNLNMPRMEISGAALSTLICRIIEMTCMLIYIFCKDKKIGYKVKDLFMSCSDSIQTYITFCIPVLISDTLLGLGNSMTAVIMGHIGASFVAANAIISQVVRMSTVFNQGVSSAASILTGNTLGAGEKKKAYSQGITLFLMSIGLGIFAAIVILIVSPFIIESFNITPETRSIAYELMWAVAIMVVFQATQSLLTKGVLRGGGDTRFLMIADIVFLWVVSVPLGYFTGLVWGCSAFVIYCALKADWAVKSALCAYRLIKGKWIKL
ncbi:MAG: MATE family efflux transporter [Lachnospiraceae bacterium]|nr:MATE family efflux transporter [Lachnospiraceae bacterium]